MAITFLPGSGDNVLNLHNDEFGIGAVIIDNFDEGVIVEYWDDEGKIDSSKFADVIGATKAAFIFLESKVQLGDSVRIL